MKTSNLTQAKKLSQTGKEEHRKEMVRCFGKKQQRQAD
jgi:hypothetical protein